MAEQNFAVESILHDLKADKRYRVICMSGDDIYVCEMDTTKLNVFALSYSVLLDWIEDGIFRIEEDEPSVIDTERLSDAERAKYENKRQMMNDVETAYGPTYLGLMGKKSKPELTALLDKYGVDKSTLWRTILKYLQSGLRQSSLADPKALGLNKGKTYEHTVKAGRKPKDFPREGYLMKEADRKHFDEALRWYAKGHCRTKRAAYLKMCRKYYYQEVVINGKAARVPAPDWEKPTLTQFYDYARKVISKEQNDVIKSSAREVRNSKRLKTGDVRQNAYGPGYIAEADEWEAHIYVVSGTNKNRTAGKPILHLLVDEYSQIILAYCVSMNNNSVIGAAGLLKNLADDKQRFCAERGVEMDKETLDALWPSNILPKIIRVDRGSEYTSTEFTRICSELGIEKQNVSGGSGSLKGVVEQMFNQIDTMLAPYLEGNGLVEKRHGSKHREEAILTIEDFDRIVLNFVLAHNQKCDKSFRMDPDMLDDDIDGMEMNAMPSLLWKYGIKKYGPPRPITDKAHFAYTLMRDAGAAISNRGICVEDLWYFADEPWLRKMMYEAGNKMVPFEARMDERSVDAVYCLKDERLVRIPLNEARSGNIEFRGMTWARYREYKEVIDTKKRAGERNNQRVESDFAEVVENIIAGAQKETYSSTKNMRETRKAEKQRVANANSLETLLFGEDGFPELSLSGNTENPLEDGPRADVFPDAGGPAGEGGGSEPEETGNGGYKDLQDAMRKYRNR